MMRAMPQVRRPSKSKRPSAVRKRAPSEKPARAAKAGPPARIPRRPTASRREALRADPSLFAPLSEGERADALRVLLEDERVREMAKIGRYRVIAVEPHVEKPPAPLSGHRLARVVAYDYAGDRAVDAIVDLDAGVAREVHRSTAQPMLSVEEERLAIEIARRDARVAQHLGPLDVPQATMHYWSRRPAELPYRRRSAAVLFGPAGERPRLVAVVDLMDETVADVAAADRW